MIISRQEFITAFAGAAMALTLSSCGSSSSTTTSSGSTSTSSEDASAKSDGVMTYAEFVEADVDSEVTVETYVQAKQSWWEDDGVGMASLYTQDADGGYFLYNLEMDEDTYDELVTGTKLKVDGYKSEWAGEVEIIDASFEVEDGSYIASATDVTDLLGSDELADHINTFVAFNGLTVEAANDAGDVYMYNYDGSGSEGDDLYFNASYNGETYTFTVESYLCDSSSDVYKAVEALQIGDVIDMEGFLYWYDGANPHITSVTVE